MALSQYALRAKWLTENGYQDYAGYLRSPLWGSIRRLVLERDGGRCFCCDGQAEQVHHKQYNSGVMEGRSMGALTAICGACHKAIEFDGEGEKVHVNVANRRMHKLRWKFQPDTIPCGVRKRREAAGRKRQRRRERKNGRK